MNEIIFRQAESKDFSQLVKLYQIPSNDTKYKLFQDWIDTQSGIFHVAVFESKVVGGVAIRFPQAGEAWLSHKMIDSTIRNVGIGSEMAHYEEEFAKEKGAKNLRLATRTENFPIHWMIGEKLGYHQISRWLRIRGLTPVKRALQPNENFFKLLQSPTISWDEDLTSVQSFITNHIDYLNSYKLIPYAQDLTIYTSFNLDDDRLTIPYRAISIIEDGKIKGTAIYSIRPSTNECIVFQIYANRQDYALYLLYTLTQYAAENKHYFSLLSHKPLYPILPLLNHTTKGKPRLMNARDWFVFGKNIN